MTDEEGGQLNLKQKNKEGGIYEERGLPYSVLSVCVLQYTATMQNTGSSGKNKRYR